MKGFTLMELIVVVSIIGILSLVLICSIQEAKEKSEQNYVEDITRER